MIGKVLEQLKKSPRLLDNIKELGIYKAFTAATVPVGDEIDSLAHLNPTYIACEPILLAYEKRLNNLLGICENIHRPLYPPSTWFKDFLEKYKRLTPSVNGKRATAVLEALSGGALNPPQRKGNVIDLGSEDPVPNFTAKKEDDQ